MNKINRLKILLARPSQYQYFFRNASDPKLFEIIEKELGAFKHIPEPHPIPDRNLVQFEPWWPGEYLIKVADKIPEKVAEVIKGIKTENYYAIDQSMKAILKMPPAVSKTLIPSIDVWFNCKYRGLVDHYSLQLLEKFIAAGDSESALQMFDILSRVVYNDKLNKAEVRYDSYTYKELKEKLIPRLLELNSLGVLKIAEKWLKKTLELENRGKQTPDDFSTVWRPAIENHEANWSFDDLKEILSEIVRDSMVKLCEVDISASVKVLSEYMKENLTIFPRIALHALRVSKGYDALVKSVLLNVSIIENYYFKHEFLLLARERLNAFNQDEQNQFFEIILEGPDRKNYDHLKDEEFEHFRNLLLRDTLASLQSIISRSDLMSKLEELNQKYGVSAHPDLRTVRTSWTGPTSPLTKDDLVRMTPESLLEYITKGFQPKDGFAEPSPNGLGRILTQVVAENPTPYSKIASKFYNKDLIYPAYTSDLIRGFLESLKDNKSLDLDEILRLCASVIDETDDHEKTSIPQNFDNGHFSWVRGSIANFLGALLRNDNIAISSGQMEKTRNILFSILRKDSDPIPEDEKKMIKDTIDYTHVCINCNRGKAIESVIEYALRWARTFRSKDEIDAEKGRGPFPPGPSRLQPEVKEFLTEHLRQEPSPSVQSAYGRYLPFFYYLDKEWLTGAIKEGLLFPRDPLKKSFWWAHMVGFVCYGDFYKDTFSLLKEDFNIVLDILINTTVDTKEKDDQYLRRLSEYLVLAFWCSISKLGEIDLFEKFLDHASENIRAHAYGYLGDGIKEQGKADPVSWEKVKGLWRARNSKNDPAVVGFIRALKYLPESIEQIQDLIFSLLPHIYRGYHEDLLVDYLEENFDQQPVICLKVLNELFKSPESLKNVLYCKDTLNKILDKAQVKYNQSRDAQTLSLSTAVINQLCEVGYYEYKDKLVKT